MTNRPVSLVTGAGRGIGRGIAVELARLGHAVVINYAGNATAAEECLQLVREAGGDGIVGAIVLVFIVLLVTDILGYTKVFPFTRQAR